MTWFFVKDGQQAGPITDIQLDEYILRGKIMPDTLVWHDGMESWQPCREVKSALVPKAPPEIILGPTAQKALDTAVEVVCSECNTLQPRENAIKRGERWICAACKPVHIQKLKEGVASPERGQAMDYAGIGVRALAKLLDGLIIGLPGVILMGIVLAVVMPAVAKNRGNGDLMILVPLGAIALIGFAMVFFQIWCLPRWGATPGKRILGLRVVTGDGGHISWGRAIGRFFGEWINGLIPFWIGYIIAGFDPERRTVHDHIAGTRVIRV